jgi:hypothetical protein
MGVKSQNEQFGNIKKLREEYAKKENPIISLDVKKRGNRQLLS